MKPKRPSEEQQAEKIEREARRFCRWCGDEVDEHRVYFGVVGPFCGVACRDAYARVP